MKDQKVVSLAERIFAVKVQTYVGDTRPSMQGIITTMARASIEAAEEFYKVLQESQSPPAESKPEKTCKKTYTARLAPYVDGKLTCVRVPEHDGCCIDEAGTRFYGKEGG